MNSRIVGRMVGFLGSSRGKTAAVVVVLALVAVTAAAYQNPFGAASAEEDDTVIRPADRAAARQNTVWAQEIEREITAQRARHVERLGRLAALKQQLTAGGAPAAQLETVNRAIAEEQTDYESRVATLQRWRERVVSPVGLPPEALRGEIDAELRDLGGAIGSLNQSFVIPPVRSRHAAAGGSRYIDREDRVDRDRRVAPVRPPLDTDD